MRAKYNNPDYIGEKYNSMTVEEIVYKDGIYFWKCRCDCGEERILRPILLINGRIKSCGCKIHLREPGLSKEDHNKKYRREYMKDLRDWRKKHHICLDCGGKDTHTMNGSVLCYECAKKRNDTKRKKECERRKIF